MNQNDAPKDGAPKDIDSWVAQVKPPTVESDPLEGVPQIDENNVDTLSEQVACALSRTSCVFG